MNSLIYSRSALLLALFTACAPVQYIRSSPVAACELDAVAYHNNAAGQPEGTTSRMRITIRPSDDDEPRIAVFEEFSGGTGEMWRSSTWVAAVHASRMVNAPLRRREISVSVGGLIDGPSAGALMTAGIAATLRGVAVRPDVTMTGTVNPDGTVGPVGGIQYKMRAAARAGKRAFGYPAGLRMQRGQNDELVDLRELAAELGIEVHEIRDVYDAFTLLTGHEIARTAPLVEERMEPSRDVEQRMRAQMNEWREVIVGQMQAFGEQPRELQSALFASLEEVAARWEESEAYLAQGLISMAYQKARESTMAADGLNQSARLLQGLVEQDLARLQGELRTMRLVSDEYDNYLASVRRLPLRTVGDAMAVMNAYSSALLANSSLNKARFDEEIAERLLAGIGDGSIAPAELEAAWQQASQSLTSAAIWYRGVHSILMDGVHAFQLSLSESSTAPLDSAALHELVHTTTVSAKAVLDNYDSIIVATTASSLHVGERQIQSRLVLRDSDYRSARLCVNLALERRDTTDRHELLFALVAAERAFLDASMLLMRDYSLGIRQDREGNNQRVSHEMAFRQALRSADRNARSGAARLLTRSGDVPDQLTATYQRARVLSEGSIDSRLISLRGFWSIALQADTAERLVAR